MFKSTAKKYPLDTILENFRRIYRNDLYTDFFTGVFLDSRADLTYWWLINSWVISIGGNSVCVQADHWAKAKCVMLKYVETASIRTRI